MSFSPLPTTDAWIPAFQLYDATGTTLLYTFYSVSDTNLPQEPVDTVVTTNFRSSGAIVINGGNKPFEAFLDFFVIGSGYTEVNREIKRLIDTIPVNVPFKLYVGLSQFSSPTTYNIKRVLDFQWLNVKQSLRNYYQEVRITLLCNAW